MAGGRPQTTFNKAQREQIGLWAAAGLTQVTIARLMGCTKETLMKHCRDDYEGGKDAMTGKLFSVSYKVAIDSEHKDRSKERQFLLKTRGGYSEKQELDVTANVQQVSKIILTAPSFTDAKAAG